MKLKYYLHLIVTMVVMLTYACGEDGGTEPQDLPMNDSTVSDSTVAQDGGVVESDGTAGDASSEIVTTLVGGLPVKKERMGLKKASIDRVLRGI